MRRGAFYSDKICPPPCPPFIDTPEQIISSIIPKFNFVRQIVKDTIRVNENQPQLGLVEEMIRRSH